MSIENPAPEADGRTRILVVDDHPAIRDGVSLVVDMQSDMVMVGEAANGEEAVERFEALLPDITLMDLRMPVKTGVSAIEAIRRRHPDARIIVLTTFEGDALALQSLRAGAAGYLLKSSLRRELLDAVRTVHAGRRHLQSDIAADIAVHAVEEQLTAREVEVLQLISVGNANRDVARALGLSEDTVKSYVKAIFAKLYVNDRTHAVTVAARRGIIEL
jgi:DNA-binding NarL/FixJ family response regulator